jgi:hypothetical protein
MADYNNTTPSIGNQISTDISNIRDKLNRFEDIVEAITNGTFGSTTEANYAVDTIASGSTISSASISGLIIKGAGNSTNFSYIDIASDESTDKIWRIVHEQANLNDFSIHYYNGSVWTEWLRLDQSAGAILRNSIDITPYYTSVSPGGDFAGGTLYLSKIGRSVTMSGSNLTHSSAGSATSSASIPSAYRPIDTVYSIVNIQENPSWNYAVRLTVNTTGTIYTSYPYFGGGYASLTGCNDFAVSWVSAS